MQPGVNAFMPMFPGSIAAGVCAMRGAIFPVSPVWRGGLKCFDERPPRNAKKSDPRRGRRGLPRSEVNGYEHVGEGVA